MNLFKVSLNNYKLWTQGKKKKNETALPVDVWEKGFIQVCVWSTWPEHFWNRLFFNWNGLIYIWHLACITGISICVSSQSYGSEFNFCWKTMTSFLLSSSEPSVLAGIWECWSWKRNKQRKSVLANPYFCVRFSDLLSVVKTEKI